MINRHNLYVGVDYGIEIQQKLRYSHPKNSDLPLIAGDAQYRVETAQVIADISRRFMQENEREIGRVLHYDADFARRISHPVLYFKPLSQLLAEGVRLRS